MIQDPTRGYIFETVRIDRQGASAAIGSGPSTGHYRLASVEVIPPRVVIPVPGEPVPADDGKVDVLIAWEPILLNEAQAAVWNTAHDPADDVHGLGLDSRTVATLEAAGATSVEYLKSMTDDEFKRLRQSGPVSFRDLKRAIGRP